MALPIPKTIIVVNPDSITPLGPPSYVHIFTREAVLEITDALNVRVTYIENNYVTKNTVQTITANKTFSGSAYTFAGVLKFTGLTLDVNNVSTFNNRVYVITPGTIPGEDEFPNTGNPGDYYTKGQIDNMFASRDTSNSNRFISIENNLNNINANMVAVNNLSSMQNSLNQLSNNFSTIMTTINTLQNTIMPILANHTTRITALELLMATCCGGSGGGIAGMFIKKFDTISANTVSVTIPSNATVFQALGTFFIGATGSPANTVIMTADNGDPDSVVSGANITLSYTYNYASSIGLSGIVMYTIPGNTTGGTDTGFTSQAFTGQYVDIPNNAYIGGWIVTTDTPVSSWGNIIRTGAFTQGANNSGTATGTKRYTWNPSIVSGAPNLVGGTIFYWV